VALVEDSVEPCPIAADHEVKIDTDDGGAGAERPQGHRAELAALQPRPGGPMHPGADGAVELTPSPAPADGAHQPPQLEVAHGTDAAARPLTRRLPRASTEE
jgi:hypothetical protein